MSQLTNPGYYQSHPEKNDEFTLLQVAKGSNTEKALEARELLIKKNEGFLKSAVLKWFNKDSGIDFDDLLQEVRLAFLAAIDNYCISKKVSIRTYAKYYLRELKRQTLKKKKKGYVEFEEDLHGDIMYLPNPDFVNLDLKSTLLRAMNACLTTVEKEVINLFYFKGLKQRQIASLRHCSETRISFVRVNAINKLKMQLTTMGIIPGFLELN